MEQFLENRHLTAIAAAFTILAASLLLVWFMAMILRRIGGAYHAIGQDPGQMDPLKTLRSRYLEAIFAVFQVPALPLTIFSAYTVLIRWDQTYRDSAAILVLAVGGLGVMVIQFVFFLRAARAFSLSSLAAGNRWLTIQSLIPLIQQGYQLFHNVPVNGTVIDHLVVGTKGIFAIHVFTPQVLTGRDSAKGATATYNGRALVYGGRTDYDTIQQAQLLTDRLSEWLSEFLSEPVAARAIIAMPGWSIKRTSAEGISVVNPKQFDALFTHIQPRPLEDADILRIADRLTEQAQDIPAGK